MQIGKKNIIDCGVYVIAEVGGNHNGDIDKALELVSSAASAGADAVKFQTYKAENLVLPSLKPLSHVRSSYASQFDRFKSLELTNDDYLKIVSLCQQLGIDFMTTPFDMDALIKFSPQMPAIKIASGDLTYKQLVEKAAALNKPVILSTGMANVEEIDNALAWVHRYTSQIVLMHCVSIYPCPDHHANLNSIQMMLEKWGGECVIGYSDHTIGSSACLAAVALGARVIEKHFTFDKNQKIGDHNHSLTQYELEDLIKQIRSINLQLGFADKKISEKEIDMRNWMRRGVYWKHSKNPGETINIEDFVFLRPENSIKPSELSSFVGRKLAVKVERHSVPSLEDLI